VTKAEYQLRMQALLDDIDTRLDLNGIQVDFDDDQLDYYDSHLDLDEDEFEES
jgi:hypothetical protein